MTVDTIFICFCEDTEDNNGADRPYFMSNGLKKVMRKLKEQAEGKFDPDTSEAGGYPPANVDQQPPYPMGETHPMMPPNPPHNPDYNPQLSPQRNAPYPVNPQSIGFSPPNVQPAGGYPNLPPVPKFNQPPYPTMPHLPHQNQPVHSSAPPYPI
jgi:hypothetical protein